MYIKVKSLLSPLSLISVTGIWLGSLTLPLNGATPVSPHELIRQALASNLGLSAQRLEVEIKEDQVRGALGEFAPQFTISVGMDRSFRAQNQREFLSTGQAARIFDEETRRVTVGIGGRLPTGATYELQGGTNRLNNTLNRTEAAPFFPEYQSSARLSVTQPLLRNFGLNVNLAPWRLLKSERRAARYEMMTEINQVIGRVLALCFELRFAEEDIKVKQQSIQLAEDLRSENRRRVEEGRMSPIDVTQAEVRLAEAREELIGARNFFAERQNALRELIGREFVFGAPDYRIEGADALLPQVSLNREELAVTLTEENPLYLAAMEVVEASDIRLAFAKNQRHPQIDLEMSFGYNGLEEDFKRSYGDFTNRESPDWSVGLVMTIPLDNRTARSRYSEANRRKTQAIVEAKQLELQLYSALDTAVRDVESAIERRQLVAESVRLAEEALQTEERRLGAGITTSYNVLNQQRELGLARTRALAADVDLQRSLIQLFVIRGTLARDLGYQTSFPESR